MNADEGKVQYASVGKRVPQIDAADKALGKALFSGDLRLPGMLSAAVLHSPIPHGRIRRIDTTRARRLAGVRVVVTGADMPVVRYGDIPDETVLATERVRYVGDEVAAVAAVDEATAREALELIEVEYEELPAVYDPLEAMEEGAPLVHQAARNIAEQYPIVRGDVERAFAEADCVLERRFVTSWVHPGYMEPMAAVAEVDGQGRITVYTGAQSPFRLRDTVAKVLGLRPSGVKVVDTYCGGGFGGKSMEKVSAISSFLALQTGRPVRLVNSRYEAFSSAHGRVPIVLDMKMGMRRDGTICGKQTRVVANNGAYTRGAPRVLLGCASRVDSLYRIRDIQTQAYLVYTNVTPTSNFRGLGNPQGHFAVESLVDALASELGLDPAEVRRTNATRTGDVTAHGWIIGSSGLPECIDAAADKVGWTGKRGQEGARGVGMGCAIHISGTRGFGFAGSSAMVKIDLDGGVTIMSGEVDMGQGVPTALAQIGAEVLGVPLEHVRMAPVDTSSSPNCLGSFASRVTHVGGNAVILAAQDARRQLLEEAAKLLEADAADLEIAEGRIFVRGAPDRGRTVADIARAAYFQLGGAVIVGRGDFDEKSSALPNPVTRYGNISGAYSFATHAAEVEVDTETGLVSVKRFVAAHDLGRAINPMAAEGQIEGSVAQGIGYALMEQMKLDANGRMINGNFADYKVPTAVDMPAVVEAVLVEPGDPNGPFGAKGVGEIGLIGTAPAMVNALHDAIGIRPSELPATPERILRALKEREKTRQPSDS